MKLAYLTLSVLSLGLFMFNVGCSSQPSGQTEVTTDTTTNPPTQTQTETQTQTPVQSSEVTTTTPRNDASNTSINTRDRDANAQTAGSQSQSKPDIDTTADIRRRIMDEKMSVNAQNVKIITVNGKVTLRGPVNSQDEKNTIGRVAGEVAGAENVDNQLDVQASD